MTDTEWRNCTDPRRMMVRELGTRKLILFSSACCRRLWNLLPDPRSRQAILALEQFADGLVPHQDLERQAESVWAARRDATSEAARTAGLALHYAVRYALNTNTTFGEAVAYDAAYAVGENGGLKQFEDERASQRELLRCIGSLTPFQPVRFDPAWRTSTTTALAAQMYESGDFVPMPIVADALQDAGCEEEQILAHCREPGPHVRGCWVVDLVSGKV